MVAEDASSGAPTIIDVRNVEIHNPGELAALEAKWLAEYPLGPMPKGITKMPTSLRPEHIFGLEYDGYRLPDGTIKATDWKGFHHDIKQIFENNGIIQIPWKKVHPNGIIEADIIYKGVMKYKTMFHPSWTRDDIMQNILEAYRNPFKIEPSHGRIKIEGLTKTGMPIRIITDGTGERFISYFPFLEGK
jgi:hypothetical protein